MAACMAIGRNFLRDGGLKAVYRVWPSGLCLANRGGSPVDESNKKRWLALSKQAAVEQERVLKLVQEVNAILEESLCR
jgi:hypothetical protein